LTTFRAVATGFSRPRVSLFLLTARSPEDGRSAHDNQRICQTHAMILPANDFAKSMPESHLLLAEETEKVTDTFEYT
jgi:hypothetical protein